MHSSCLFLVITQLKRRGGAGRKVWERLEGKKVITRVRGYNIAAILVSQAGGRRKEEGAEL